MGRSPCRPVRLWASAVARVQVQETGWGETGCREHPADSDSGVSQLQKQGQILPEEPRTLVLTKLPGSELETAPRDQIPSAEIQLQLGQ